MTKFAMIIFLYNLLCLRSRKKVPPPSPVTTNLYTHINRATSSADSLGTTLSKISIGRILILAPGRNE